MTSRLRRAGAAVLDFFRGIPRDPWSALALGVLFAATARVLWNVVLYRDVQMDMDEAVHARNGQEYARALGAFSLDELGQLLRRPQWHPPAAGLTLGAWFSSWSSSVVSARLFSVFCFFFCGLALWLTALELCPKHRSRLAFFPLLFFALDDEHARAAGLSMLEMPSELWTTLALYLFVLGSARSGNHSLALHAAATAAALLAFFTRYGHGLAVLGALAAGHVASAFGALRASDTRRLVAPAMFFVTAGAVVGIWLFGFEQLRWLLQYSVAQPRTVPRWSLENALYYPAFLFERSPFGPIVLATFAIGLADSFVRRRLNRDHLVFLLYFAAALAISFFVKQKSPRFGIILGAPIWILSAAFADGRLPSAARADGWLRALVLAGSVSLVGFLIHDRPRFPNAYENTDGGLTEIYRAVSDVVRPWERARTNVVLIGRDDLRSGVALAFHLTSTCEQRGVSCDVSVLDEAELELGWPRGTVSRGGYRARLKKALHRASYVVVYGARKAAVDDWHPLFERSFSYRKSGKRASRLLVSVRVPRTGH